MHTTARSYARQRANTPTLPRLPSFIAGEGGVSIIGANKAALAEDGIGPTAPPQPIPECTGSFSGSGACTFSPGSGGRGGGGGGGGSWVTLGMDVVPAGRGVDPPLDAVVKIKCTTPPKTPATDPFLCSYAVNTSIGMFNQTSLSTPHHASSCSFLLPEGGETVVCEWSTVSPSSIAAPSAASSSSAADGIAVLMSASASVLRTSPSAATPRVLNATCPIVSYVNDFPPYLPLPTPLLAFPLSLSASPLPSISHLPYPTPHPPSPISHLPSFPWLFQENTIALIHGVGNEK